MSNKKTTSHNLLKNKVSSVFSMLRYVFKDNKQLLRSIDEALECALLDSISLIPLTWVDGCLETFDMVLDFTKCIDYNKLYDAIEKHGRARVWFEVNSYDFFIDNCIRTQDFSENAKKTIINLTQDFKPLFNCIDYMFEKPSLIMGNVAEYNNPGTENNNILNDIF